MTLDVKLENDYNIHQWGKYCKGFFIIPALIFVATSFAAKFTTVYLSAKSQGLDKKMSIQTAFGSSASGGELALVTAKGGADVGATSPFVLPMVGTMTILTSFLSPYVVRFGWRIGERFEQETTKEPESGEDNEAQG